MKRTKRIFFKHIILIVGMFSSILAQDVQLSIGNVDELNQTFDIIYTSSVDLYGFQFEISGVTIENVVSDLNGMVSNSNTTVLGLTLSQDPLMPSANNAVLLSIEYQL